MLVDDKLMKTEVGRKRFSLSYHATVVRNYGTWVHTEFSRIIRRDGRYNTR